MRKKESKTSHQLLYFWSGQSQEPRVSHVGYRNSGTGASSAVPRCTGAGIGAQARQAAALPPVSQWAHPEEFL